MNLPTKWRETSLNECTFKIGSGKTPKGGDAVYVNKGILFIRSQNVYPNKLILGKCAYITDEINKSMLNSQVKKDDVLLNITGASIGRACVYNLSIAANVNQHVCIIRNNKDIDPHFLCEFLNSEKGQNQIKSFLTKGNREGLNFQQIGSFKFPVPSLPEQKKIAEILSCWDRGIEEALSIMDKRINWLNEQFKNTISTIIKTPKCKLVKLQEIAKITDGAHKTPSYIETGIPFLRITDIQSDEIDLSKVKFISTHEHKELTKRCKPERGDILYSKNGTIGIAKIVDWNWEFSTFVSLALIKILNKDEIRPEYLLSVLTSRYIEEQYKRRMKSGTITNLHLEEMREFEIPLPDISTQDLVCRLWGSSVKIQRESESVLKLLKMQKKHSCNNF